jgi:muramoyltetrapeptide carboxypeptidase
MDIPIVRPAALKPGDTIAIIAPAGPIEHRDDFQRGVAMLERMGFRVRWDDRIFHSVRYLAGADEERAAEFMRAIEDPSVDALLSLRGGYGCSRLIPLIRPQRIRDLCKIFMGFSDLTTLHLYLRRRLGWVTFHGPMASSPFLGNMDSAQLQHLLSLWTDPSFLPVFSFPQFQTLVPGSAEGELTGGCLSLIVASLGTPYEIATDGKVLFIEDFGEPPYRIDRMITQLRLARKLDRVAGVLLGSFQDCDSPSPEYTLEDTLHDLLGNLRVPVLAGFPAGHGAQNWAIPLGVRIRLDASNCRVEFMEPALSATD